MVLSFFWFVWVWLDVLSAGYGGFRRSSMAFGDLLSGCFISDFLFMATIRFHLLVKGDGFENGLCLLFDLVYGPVGTGLQT